MDDVFPSEVVLYVCSQEDWGQMTMQAEEVAITEEDLELIKERETNIRQLEVSLSSPSWLLASRQIMS